MIPILLKRAIEETLTEKLNATINISGESSIGVGCINSAHRIETNEGSYFLKWNNANAYPGMFEAEAKGLSILKEADAIPVPSVIATGEGNNQSFIILEMIAPGKPIKKLWHDFGQRLAKLHRHSSSSFGFHHDNYIGSLPHSNNQHPTRTDFFIHERLEKQIALANNSGAIDASTSKKFNNLYNRFEELIPKEKSALLHGDLWNGNYMVAGNGEACLIDPAVYYGHREMDLAMTRLFGGFPEEFYEAYHSTY